MSDKKLKLGVSACLLGEEVRFNGGHCRNNFITTTLSEFADFMPTCPEQAIGMGVPREAVRLEYDANSNILMKGSRSSTDYTEEMSSFSQSWADELNSQDLDGYILKKDSPSCGVFRVKIYKNNQVAERRGTGLFAKALMKANPLLPIEEDGRLSDPLLREHFIERVFAYNRLKQVFNKSWSRKDIVDFHSREKLLLMAHSPKHYQQLGRLVGNLSGLSRDEFTKQYCEIYMTCLSHKASKGRHANTLCHLIGYFKKQLSPSGKKEMTETIADYQNGLLPLAVPISLIRHLARRFDCTYLLEQVYLDPHPKTLMLRNYT